MQNQSQQQKCDKCQLFLQNTISTQRCAHRICQDCLKQFYQYIQSLVKNDKNKGNSEEFYNCITVVQTQCPHKIKLELYDTIFKTYIPNYQSIITSKGEQHHITNQNFYQQQEQMKSQNQTSNKYQNIMDFDKHDDIQQDKPNNLIQSQQVKPSIRPEHNIMQSQQVKPKYEGSLNSADNLFANQMNQMKSLVKNFSQEEQKDSQNLQNNNKNNIQSQEQIVQGKHVQGQNLVQQQMFKQNSNPLKLLTMSLSQNISGQILKSKLSKGDSLKQQSTQKKIEWKIESFGQYLELYGKAQNYVQSNLQDSLSNLYIDPFPQMEFIGKIDTTEDFANSECTITDDKLKVAREYAQKMPLRRKIRGDGNCFYRSIMVQFIEKILVTNTANRALTFLEQVMDQNFQIIDVVTDNCNPHLKKKIPDLVRLVFIKKLLQLIDLRCEVLEKNQSINVVTNQLEQIMMNDTNFDFSLVVVGRSLGMLAVNTYGQHDEYIAFCNDIDTLQQLLVMYGQDVELVIIPIITEVLDITLSVHTFDQVKNNWVIGPTTYSPKVNIQNFIEENQGLEHQNFLHFQIDVLLHSGHYQLIYSQLYSKLVYGTINNQVKPFNRQEWQEEQERKLLMQSKYQVKVKIQTCLVCNNKALCACTKQCQHYYCVECLQNMITFMEQRQYTYYDCHYKGIIQNCGKKLLMVEFYEMLSQFSNHQADQQKLHQQKQINKCTRCSQSFKNNQHKQIKCGHKYCLDCINYILDKLCYSKVTNNYQCKFEDFSRNQCSFFIKPDYILNLITDG